jgi:hypothetical protein
MAKPSITQTETIRKLSEELKIPTSAPKDDADARYVIDDLVYRARKARRKRRAVRG